MPVSEKTFEAVVLEDSDGQWELHRGKLREKPTMSFGHNVSARELAYQLTAQLDRREYHVFQNSGHLRAPDGNMYIPDVAVVPVALMSQFSLSPARFEVYDQPLPFLTEVWSPKTGTFDVDTKFPAYRLRGDAEIWRLHPFKRTLKVWRRQSDGGYEVSDYEGGSVRLHALPWVAINLDALFGSM
ncbi:MAG TPA: Uma2 family endonuclease [Thermomicrobiales bacterium]|jgi:Uma2 family endonuclease